MITAAQALSSIPPGLRDPLIAEYQTIVQNFLERRWLPTELSGGRFAEIVFTILQGHAAGTYATTPSKPANFVSACRSLESNTQVPHSFQILIPRMLPALYDIRNNRSVGHVGGDVDPNHMDSVAVLSMCNWIMAELVRVFHNLTVVEAQAVVELLAEIRIPVIWTDGNIKRVLRPELKVNEQLLLLVATSVPHATTADLLKWLEKTNKHVMNTIRLLHKKRLLEYDAQSGTVRILPPGSAFVADLVKKKHLKGIG
jgi:hypothetical protein